MNQPLLFWFRKDLRLTDNTALKAAAQTGRPIICTYILDEDNDVAWPLGKASRWWLQESLKSLGLSLQQYELQLVLRRGDSVEQLSQLIKETGASSLYFSAQYEPSSLALEQKLNLALKDQIEVKRFKGYLLYEPNENTTAEGKPYKVFTPFYKACLKKPPSTALPAPEQISAYPEYLASDDLLDWDLALDTPTWAQEYPPIWKPGEDGADWSLQAFIRQGVGKYPELRNRPDIFGTSRLSPHLHFGEISPRQIWNAINQLNNTDNEGVASYQRELIWREFSYNLLINWPDFPEQPFRSEFKAFPWHDDDSALHRWQQGQTGYPIVDAGMRELLHTGWMHNRVRMIVASFLIKDLLIPWQQGEKWFWQHLLDANLASNSASWQWVAGCGADAAPYFRVFNPVLQGEKFDPNGDYVRQWVPELDQLSKAYIHSPWEASADELQLAGIRLDKTYPSPIVNHKKARLRALAAFEVIKKKSQVVA